MSEDYNIEDFKNIICDDSYENLEIKGKIEIEEILKDFKNTLKEPLIIYEERIIFIMGKTGAGKSNFVNHILKRNYFESSDQPNAVTANVQNVKYMRNIGNNNFLVTLYDTPGFFDPNVDNKNIAIKLSKFLYFELTYLNLALIFVPKGRLTKEFINSIEECLIFFKKDQIKKFVKIIVTNCGGNKKQDWVDNFFKNDIIINLNKKWSIERNNYLFVDLNLSENDFKGDCEDRDILELLIYGSNEKAFKSELINIIDDNSIQIKSLTEKLLNALGIK